MDGWMDGWKDEHDKKKRRSVRLCEPALKSSTNENFKASRYVLQYKNFEI